MKQPEKQYRSGGPGSSFMIDREVRGVGRVRRASGLTVESQFDLLNAAIPTLAKSKKGRALLLALKDGTISGVQLYVAVKTEDLDSVAVGDEAHLLHGALDKWLSDTERSVAKATVRGRAEMIRAVRKHSKPSARVGDLPNIARTMKLKMASAHSFNLDLQYLSAFVRDTMGRRAEVYLDLRDIDVRKTSPQTSRNPLTPRAVLALATAFDRIWKAKQGSRGDEVFAMAFTGMGPTEYWGRWTVRSDRVHIEGTKRAGRVRDVPRLFPCAIYDRDTISRPSITLSSFARALTIASVATGIACSPYDLRRTFGNWLEQAGILRSRRRQYLGHAIGDVTERYERHAIDKHLLDDGKMVRAWIATSIEGANTGQPEQTPDSA